MRVDEFLDPGSGIPPVVNGHEVARQHSPQARVVHVDVEPAAVSRSESILRGTTPGR